MSMVMGIISIAAGLAGGAMSANAQRQAAETEAQAQEYNARVQREEARAAKEAYAREEELSRDKAKQLRSRQIALYSKAGVDISSGSPLVVMAHDAEEAEKDALIIRKEGDTVANRYTNHGNLYNWYAGKTRKAGQAQANTTMISSIGNAASSYYSMRKA